MANELLSYAGWTFLPGLVSGWIQTVYYGITIRAGDPKPQPGSPKYLKHRRIIQSTVILAYLLYTIYEADYWVRQNADFYQILGIPLDADEKRIKSRFRRLAALYHPDKLTSDDPTLLSAAESHFVLLKNAQDTLTDPPRRFAYERYGPDILNWQHCVTIRDYLAAGTLQVQAPLYAGALTFLGLLSFTSYLQAGRFWRYLFSFMLVALECHTISRPYFGPVLTKVVNPLLSGLTRHPPLLPFQLLVLARKATLTVFIAISQLSGLFPLATPPPAGSAVVRSPEEMRQLQRLEQLAQANDAEAGRLLQMDMAPFVEDAEGTRELKDKVKEWAVNNVIRADPEVRDAIGRTMGRRRTGAPAGARV